MATMQDVARRAQVSVATVSFVVNGTKPISPATRDRVEQAMRDLGYRRNPVGAALARGSTKIIGLLYPALQRPLSGTAVGFITAATVRAHERGYSLVLWPVSNDGIEATALGNTGLVDGLLLMEVEMDDQRIPALNAGRTPFALIGRTEDPTGLTYVDVDFDTSIDRAVEALAARGHRHLALVTGGWGASYYSAHGAAIRSQRRFLDVANRNGLEGQILHCAETSSDGRKFGRMLPHEHPDITGLLLMNEHAAPGIVIGLREQGKHVPEDLSIISIGSSEHMAGMADPPLTYMQVHTETLGRAGADALIDRIEDPTAQPPPVIIACDMREGGTLAVAPRG